MLTTKQESWKTAEQLRNALYYYYYGDECSECHAENHVRLDLLYTPLLLNVTLLPCPLGFQLRGDPPGCECHPVLTVNNVMCQFINHTGYHIWNGPLWLADIINDIDSDVHIELAQYCPFDYCKSDEKFVNLH